MYRALVVLLSAWTLSSAGERFLHTEEVTGSIPVVSTTTKSIYMPS